MVNIDPDAALYKYLPLNALLDLIESKTLIMNQITKWPDVFEGGRYKIAAASRKENHRMNSFYGSSWCTQTERMEDYNNENDLISGNKEIITLGSASMWAAYCNGGGARIRTTIGKILSIYSEYNIVCHGKVKYEPAWVPGIMPHNIIDNLLHKRVCFRHENEYRFIIQSETQVRSKDIDLSDFIDEVLVAPNTAENAWASRAVYKYITNQNFALQNTAANTKNGSKLCRVSCLYGNISEEL